MFPSVFGHQRIFPYSVLLDEGFHGALYAWLLQNLIPPAYRNKILLSILSHQDDWFEVIAIDIQIYTIDAK